MTRASEHVPLALNPLAVAHLTMAEPLVITGAPRGTVVFVQLTEGRFAGRLEGTVRAGSASDWVHVGADGSGDLDVRFVLETTDGALISVRCHGRIYIEIKADALLAITFDTGAERYRHFNTMVSVARVATRDLSLRYDVYEVCARN